MSTLRHPLTALALAACLSVPWMIFWGGGTVDSLGVGSVVAVSGLAVLGASFLLAWGAETAEKDVPRGFAIAVLAVLAVAPEYAVDALYAYTAGANPGDTEAANLAVANMTGANRILIGLGWAGIALFAIYKTAKAGHQDAVEWKEGFLTDAVILDRSIATEVAFLTVATLYAFLVPLTGGINIVDTVVLVGLYVAYIIITLRADVEDDEVHVGVPAYLQQFVKPLRAATVITLFAYSGFLIMTAVEPFAHGLESLGKDLGIPAFFMIQWIAPLASESPELIVTVYLVNKARSTAAFNALISSKLNQWTLLIGTLTVVYSIGLGRYGALPFNSKQAWEIWLTAGQSLFALSILLNFRISIREALTLLVLFLSQVFIEFYLIQTMPELETIFVLQAYTAVYVVAALGISTRRVADIQDILRRTVGRARGRDIAAD
ncbi:sodium:calcium antiporter [Haloparvum sp. PAK95]|uniref:sodium:calcium antiporter n=1 Tax=Haloparvum sp. PAK95 TaxID=3418962 RepID=UPI003D2EF365